ncbi:MAG: SEC-C metal-binding domain-containing protein [Bacillota bacterium]|nr:SEC-C metal-binding domain-containing protein [Bacillota bacterium]
MNKKEANKIFEKYNSKSDVVRCPYGRAGVRKLLDTYAVAAVNLYGIISKKDLVEIFNKQNEEQTTVEEIYILLLPLVLKERWYGFYKDYIVHYWFFDDFEQADNLLTHHAEKPRYVPNKEEFLKYKNEDYEDNDSWWDVRRFLWDVFGYSRDASQAYWEIKDYMIYSDGISELGPILDKYNLRFTSEKQLQKFIDLLMSAKNNTRTWLNNGHTPVELHEIFSKRDETTLDFPIRREEKIGRNDPCPCGSGKKYKKCCGRFENTKSAQLSSEECQEFYETWYGLMGFINEKLNVVDSNIKAEYPNDVSDEIIHKVREILWENPELIDEYISETNLDKEKVDVLKLWKTNHKKGMFILLEYQQDYAVALAPNEKGEDRLYGIKGISNSISNVLRRPLPLTIETVILSFKGKIIYDSFMIPMPVTYGKGARAAFKEMYDNAKEHGIITSLE